MANGRDDPRFFTVSGEAWTKGLSVCRARRADSTATHNIQGARDRLIRLAATNSEWALGFEDECWWSGFAQPAPHAFSEAGEPMRLIQQTPAKDDPDPKALCAYGMLARSTEPDGEADLLERVFLRFVDGRPVSSITTRFLDWSCQRLQRMGKKALLLIWDNASWHKSREVEDWIALHNRAVKDGGSGVRIVSRLLPTKSPWLNPIEPMWIHGKRKVIEPDGLLGAYELADRVCGVFGCEHESHLSIDQEVA